MAADGAVERPYRRILLKLSGEALAGDGKHGNLDPEVLKRIAAEIREVTLIPTDARGGRVQVAVVVGGGNIFRGTVAGELGIDRATGDYMGMLATVINALALRAALETAGVDTRVQSAIEMREVAEPYIPRRAVRHLDKGRVVIFAAGLGHPHFTTDTAGAQRALEIEADVILKATNVDGVYSADPKRDPNAQRLPRVSYQYALVQRLQVMDATAFSLCMDNQLPIVIFDLNVAGNISRIVLGEPVCSIVSAEGG